MAALASPAGQDGGSPPAELIDFNIPAQPLGRALIAFGATAGFDLYYNAAFAEGRRSVAVTGRLKPALALQLLLQGTGLVPRMTGPTAVILVPAPQQAALASAVAAAAPGRYEPYFAMIQARISDVLCRDARAGREANETLLRVWLATSGVIDRVEVLDGSAGHTDSGLLVGAVRGLLIGAPPPRMPQPVTLVVFPPSAGQHDCSSANARGGAN